MARALVFFSTALLVVAVAMPNFAKAGEHQVAGFISHSVGG